MRLLAALGAVAASLLVGAPLAAALTPPNLYWANENGNDIGEASLDGTNVTQEFIAGAHSPFAVVVDGQHIYWSNINFFAEPSIGVANLDGTSVNQTLITGVNSVGPIAVNGQHIFFSEADSIGEANLDGSGVNQNFITGLEGVLGGLAVDGQHIYWSTTGQQIGRANLDGTGIDQSFITDPNFPTGIAVDGQHIYWGNENPANTIGEANLDGTDVNESFITGADDPAGVAVDAQHIYWTNENNGTIGEANLDGTDVNQSFISGASDPRGVAVSVPIAQVTPATPPAFALTPQGSLSAPLALTVANAGQRTLSVTGLSFTGVDPGDFLVGADSCLGEVAPGNSCQLEVYFTPGGQGTRSATLLIASTDLANSPVQVALSGSGGSLPQGPPGMTGTTGATGTSGGRGATGPQGPPGQIELIECKTVIRTRGAKHHKRKVKQQKCTGKRVSGTVKFTTAADRATLSRAGAVYAAGEGVPFGHGSWQLVLADLRPLDPGSYTLAVRSQRGHRWSIRRTRIRFR